MENEVRVKTVPRSKRVAFTGYRPQKMGAFGQAARNRSTMTLA